MNIVVAGASGFLGSHLVDHLRAHDHTVTRLVRRPAAAEDESTWDPPGGTLDEALVKSADVVINLAGSPLLGNPHSKKWAAELVSSRISTTRLLAETIAGSDHPPAFLAGNGISIYGDHADDPIDETTTSLGDAFLTGVTQLWEAATGPALEAGARVCVLRTAPVLDRTSPPLKMMLLPFKAGLGARIGDGRQYFPVISLRDWVGAVTHLVESDTASGPFNLCCPTTPTNDEFTQALARACGRRARLAVPSLVIKKAAGPMSPEVLGSLRTEPVALHDDGFEFHDTDVRDVLATALRS
ncbi:MAG: TIGR01777 family oxidoreductase [Nocardioides sp.]|nr:TIGR01777 family oxidoreductase [Nocardioides sp.]